ncbi:MAG: adenylate/guanylate cyclase domain-containing protein [Balneolales bacterium]
MQTARISIRWKLMLSLIGFSIGMIGLILYGISRSVENRVKEEIDSNFREAGRIFDRIQEIRFRQIRQTAVLLADIPTLKAAVSTGDTNTVNRHIREELRFLLDYDPLIPDDLVPEAYYADPDSGGLLIVTGPDGYPVGQLATTPLPDYSLAGRTDVREALQGSIPQNITLWRQDDRYFNVISVPIFLRDRILGTLTYGLPLRRAEAEFLSTDLGNQISYFVDNRIISTSFSNLSQGAFTHLANSVHNATFGIINSGEPASFDLEMDGETWLIYVSPMQYETVREADVPGYYVVAQSLFQELDVLRRLQYFIFGIGFLAIVVAIGFGIGFTRHITRPINLLISGINRIEQGDYSEKVPVVSRDELGMLTRTFNNLVENLRERLMMLKFVSEATQEAIRSNLSEIKLGGENKVVTVLFSDIRGFTGWGEKRTPEEVIEMLNTFFRMQTGIVKDHQGDVDKFVGDELVAVFQGKGMEQNAVNAAIEIQKRTREMTSGMETPVSVGIGINAGEVIMGAMGSEERMDFTVLGNNVNLGARLGSVAQPDQILISLSVYKKLERSIETRTLEPVAVKGIEKPVEVFEVVWDYIETEAGYES